MMTIHGPNALETPVISIIIKVTHPKDSYKTFLDISFKHIF